MRHWILIVGCLIFFALAGTGHAGDYTILSPGTEQDLDEMVLEEERALPAFDDVGRIDRIGEGEEVNEIVLDDSLFTLSSNVRCYSSRGIPIPKSRLARGQEVGCIVNEQGEIIALWQIRD